MERRTMTIAVARSTPKMEMRPCRSCTKDPVDCGKQMSASAEGIKDTIVLCQEGKGWIRHEEDFVTVDRSNVYKGENVNNEDGGISEVLQKDDVVFIRIDRLRSDGESRSNRKVHQAEEAAV